MARTFTIILLLLMSFASDAQTQLRFVSYNCENLFDCRHDSLKNDYEFLPDAERHWTWGRYWKKLNAIGRVIHECGASPCEHNNKNHVLSDSAANATAYHLPDLVTLVEVENDSVLFMLTRRSMLKGAGYRYVMTNSPDPRGVDVALLYNPLTFRLTDHHSLRVTPPKDSHATRDILYVKGIFRGEDTLHIFCVHAPSRGGGQKETEPYRMAVAQRICQSIDSIRATNPDANIIIAGDFNDYSRDKALKFIAAHNMTEAGITKTKIKTKNHTPTNIPTTGGLGGSSIGSYKYQGQWNSLDHIFLSAPLHKRLSSTFILHNKWMTEEDTQGGYKPFRTYLGPIYHGGVSDHLPLVITLQL